mmetsp:Transcript_18815/g.47613  ORF Transcript_18815/g.47613 Transcript_18815/m.47613 type:complete len:200 (+) Transcript_18815:648-1247(+)
MARTQKAREEGSSHSPCNCRHLAPPHMSSSSLSSPSSASIPSAWNRKEIRLVTSRYAAMAPPAKMTAFRLPSRKSRSRLVSSSLSVSFSPDSLRSSSAQLDSLRAEWSNLGLNAPPIVNMFGPLVILQRLMISRVGWAKRDSWRRSQNWTRLGWRRKTIAPIGSRRASIRWPNTTQSSVDGPLLPNIHSLSPSCSASAA